MSRPTCVCCGKQLRRYRHRDWYPERQWGDYGDGFLCGMRCGYEYALRLLHRAGTLALTETSISIDSLSLKVKR